MGNPVFLSVHLTADPNPLGQQITGCSAIHGVTINMCGILGMVGAIKDVSQDTFQSALNAIAHRGPDAQATWRTDSACLGHRRLAIIDLSERGTQPMVDEESGLIIVFNGEIYNYIELRDELTSKGYRFRSDTDTEVLLKGFLEWGDDVLARCNGMWALAIWDPRERRVFLARDRFGVKPLYYALQQGRLFFASEPKALHILDKALTEPDESALVDFVVDSRMHIGSRTFYRSIRAIPPSYCATYVAGDDDIAQRRYWDYPDPQPEACASMDADEQFAELLVDAVRVRLRSDVRVGLTLSGGLDSSAVLAAVKDLQGASLHCYTSVFSGAHRGEERWAEIAANYAGASVEPVEASFDDWLPTLSQIVRHMDGPGFSPAVFPLWAIMSKARRDNTPVLLEGQGADELLAGYPQYPAIATLEHLKACRIFQFANGVYKMRETFTARWTAGWLARRAFPGPVSMFTRRHRLELFQHDCLQAWQNRGTDPTVSSQGRYYDPVRAELWNDHAINVLPALLHYGDSISMAHGIETRLPFMDYRLVEWVFRSRQPLFEDGMSKSMVRSFLRNRKFDAIADRKDKQGYPTPITDWYKSIGVQYCQDILSDRNSLMWNIFAKEHIRRLADSAGRGSVRGIFHLYKILTIDLWLKDLKQRMIELKAA